MDGNKKKKGGEGKEDRREEKGARRRERLDGSFFVKARHPNKEEKERILGRGGGVIGETGELINFKLNQRV